MFDPSRAGGLAGDGSRVDGPLLATFSAADRAVGWWYPAASMLAGQDSESATDLVFRWGGMGHDGYQQTPSPTTVALAAQGQPYGFTTGRFYSLDANASYMRKTSRPSAARISDIQHPEVLWAVVSSGGSRRLTRRRVPGVHRFVAVHVLAVQAQHLGQRRGPGQSALL